MDACFHRDSESTPSTSERRPIERFSASLSLVLPAFNEAQVIEQAVREADTALASLVDDYEIIVVDDGSTDETASLVTKLAATNGRVRLVQQPRNMGYGAALRRGFSAATKQLVSFTDADCQFDLRELDRLLLLARDYDLVCGYRIDRKDAMRRCVYSKVYNVIASSMLGTRVRDIDCAMKVFHRSALQRLPITTNGFIVNAELLTRARQHGMKVVEVGVSHRPRVLGESKVSLSHVPPVLMALFRFWWTVVMFPTTSKLPESHMHTWPPGKRAVMTTLLALVSGILLFTNLNYPLIEPDETRYAQIGLEMYESGDYVVPTFDGEPYLDKPPLLYWLTAAGYSAFGIHEWTARLPSTLAAFVTVMVAYLIGRKLIGDKPAWIGCVLLLLCAAFPLVGRFLIMDSLLTAFTTIALLASAVAWRTDHPKRSWLALAGVALAFGVMTKGPVAWILCVPPVFGVAWLTSHRSLYNWRVWVWLLVPTLLVTTPWFWLMAQRQDEFAGHFLWKHHLVRFFQAFDHREPWWFYIPVLAFGMFPASLLFPGVAAYLFGRSEQYRNSRTPESGFLALAGLWVVGFFSLSSCKLPTYILPALPMLCLFGGKMFRDTVLAGKEDWLPRRLVAAVPKLMAALLFVLALLAGGADLILGKLEWPEVTLVGLFTLAAAVLAVASIRAHGRHALRPWAVAACLSLVLGSYGFNCVLPQFADWRGLASHAAALQSQLGGSKVPVVYYKRSRHGGAFYIREGQVVEFTEGEAGALESYASQSPVTVIVTSRHDADELRRCCPGLALTEAGGRGNIYIAKSIPKGAERPLEKHGLKLR